MYLHKEELDILRQFDPEIARLAEDEERRQTDTLSLIPSENYTSPVVSSMEGSIFACKNAQGYIGNRVSGGCETADALEGLAIERCKKLFGCEHECHYCQRGSLGCLAGTRGYGSQHVGKPWWALQPWRVISLQRENLQSSVLRRGSED